MEALNANEIAIPPGAWGVAVSGGADSVALLLLAAARPDVSPHVLHLNHQLRGAASDEDAAFVQELAGRLHLPVTIAARDEIERSLPTLPANPSARYRSARYAFFACVARAVKLDGVFIAHHADDVAETVLQRLIRGSGYEGIGGIAAVRKHQGVVIHRPLLGIKSQALREYLRSRGQSWREDSSNLSLAYQRNRVRQFLAAHPALVESLHGLARRAGDLHAFSRQQAPRLGEGFDARELADLPDLLAAAAAKRWLLERGVPATFVDADAAERLTHLSRDRAAARIIQYPGGITIHRRKNRIAVRQH